MIAPIKSAPPIDGFRDQKHSNVMKQQKRVRSVNFATRSTPRRTKQMRCAWALGFRTRHRHAELGSASMRHSQPSVQLEPWTLKQVQGDDRGSVDAFLIRQSRVRSANFARKPDALDERGESSKSLCDLRALCAKSQKCVHFVNQVAAFADELSGVQRLNYRARSSSESSKACSECELCRPDSEHIFECNRLLRCHTGLGAEAGICEFGRAEADFGVARKGKAFARHA